jgi:YD repeat-containing protein
LTDVLKNGVSTHYAYDTNGNRLSVTKDGNSVHVNVCERVSIATSIGTRIASPARILAHELGHLTGTDDDGENQMNNVNQFENPIMSPLEGFSRTEY